MARTVTSPRILHVSQGFTLHALPDHHPPPFDGAGVEQGQTLPDATLVHGHGGGGKVVITV
jgi:hypothetical protein